MKFNEKELSELRAYVQESGIDDLVTISHDHITVVSEDYPDRFVATISVMALHNGYGFALFVEDCRPAESELGFSYGLPIRVSLPETKWTLIEVLRQTMNLLTDISDAVKSLGMVLTGLRNFAGKCGTLNTRLVKFNAVPLSVPLELARTAARSVVDSPLNVDVTLSVKD